MSIKPLFDQALAEENVPGTPRPRGPPGVDRRSVGANIPRMIFRGSQVAIVAAYFVLLIVAGTVGYELIERWNWADSFYMTIITITAVGYHEVHPLSETGRIFTVVMLVGGLTGMGAWFALVTAAFVRMDLRNTYKRRRAMKKVSRMKDHVIICGGGNMGQQIMRELDGADKALVVIERHADAIESLREISPDTAIIEEDATRDRVLREAGIGRAMALVTCLSADTDNLFVCLSARDLNTRLVIVARAEGKSTTAKMYRAGADHVVSPNKTGAVWVASVLVRPSVASFMDLSEKGRHLSRHIDQATVGVGSKLVGRTLGEASILNETGLLVIAIHKFGQPYEDATFNPDASILLEAGDDLIVLGDDAQVERLRDYVG